MSSPPPDDEHDSQDDLQPLTAASTDAEHSDADPRSDTQKFLPLPSATSAKYKKARNAQEKIASERDPVWEEVKKKGFPKARGEMYKAMLEEVDLRCDTIKKLQKTKNIEARIEAGEKIQEVFELGISTEDTFNKLWNPAEPPSMRKQQLLDLFHKDAPRFRLLLTELWGPGEWEKIKQECTNLGSQFSQRLVKIEEVQRKEIQLQSEQLRAAQQELKEKTAAVDWYSAKLKTLQGQGGSTGQTADQTKKLEELQQAIDGKKHWVSPEEVIKRQSELAGRYKKLKDRYQELDQKYVKRVADDGAKIKEIENSLETVKKENSDSARKLEEQKDELDAEKAAHSRSKADVIAIQAVVREADERAAEADERAAVAQEVWELVVSDSEWLTRVQKRLLQVAKELKRIDDADVEFLAATDVFMNIWSKPRTAMDKSTPDPRRMEEDITNRLSVLRWIFAVTDKMKRVDNSRWAILEISNSREAKINELLAAKHNQSNAQEKATALAKKYAGEIQQLKEDHEKIKTKLEEDKAAAQGGWDEERSKLVAVQNELNTKENEVEDLTDKLSNHNQLSEDLKKARDELENTKTALNSKTEEKNKLTAQAEHDKKELEQTKALLNTTTANLTTLNANFDMSERDRTAYEGVKKERDQLQGTTDGLRDEVKSLQEKLQTAKSEAAKVPELQVQITNLKEAADQAQGSFERSRIDLNYRLDVSVEEAAQLSVFGEQAKTLLGRVFSSDPTKMEFLFTDMTIGALNASIRKLHHLAVNGKINQWCESIVIHEARLPQTPALKQVLEIGCMMRDPNFMPNHPLILSLAKGMVHLDEEMTKMCLVILEYCILKPMGDEDVSAGWTASQGLAWLRAIDLLCTVYNGGRLRLRPIAKLLDTIDLNEARKLRLVDKFFHYVRHKMTNPQDLDKGFGGAIRKFTIESEFSFTQNEYMFVVDIESIIVAKPNVDNYPVEVIEANRFELKLDMATWVVVIKDFEQAGMDLAVRIVADPKVDIENVLSAFWKKAWDRMQQELHQSATLRFEYFGGAV